MQPDLQVTTVPVAALLPYAENARTHSDDQVAQIAASIAEFGFVNPVLVDTAGVLVAGHGRVMAANRSAKRPSHAGNPPRSTETDDAADRHHHAPQGPR